MAAHYTEFEWDDYNSGKNLCKHNVTDNEIEQVFKNPYIKIQHKKYTDRRLILGRTDGGRYLFMSIQHVSSKCCRPIHARDMETHELKKYKNIIGYRKN
jgi:uncharacterized DUF497 family protein